jgi:hypothetical protein
VSAGVAAALGHSPKAPWAARSDAHLPLDHNLRELNMLMRKRFRVTKQRTEHWHRRARKEMMRRAIIALVLSLFGVIHFAYAEATSSDGSPTAAIASSFCSTSGACKAVNPRPNAEKKILEWLFSLLEFRLTDLLLVIFTLVLANKTGGLYTETAALRAAADQQREDMIRSIRAAEKAAEAAVRTVQASERTERARVFFRVVNTGLDVDSKAVVQPDGTMKCGFRNVGRTPAILIEQCTLVSICAKGFPPEVDRSTNVIGVAHALRTAFPLGYIIAEGDAHDFTENTTAMPINFGPQWYEFAENSGKRSNLFLIGYLRYEDVFGTKYMRGYCAFFDIYSNRFVHMGGERYNYERIEE